MPEPYEPPPEDENEKYRRIIDRILSDPNLDDAWYEYLSRLAEQIAFKMDEGIYTSPVALQVFRERYDLFQRGQTVTSIPDFAPVMSFRFMQAEGQATAQAAEQKVLADNFDFLLASAANFDEARGLIKEYLDLGVISAPEAKYRNYQIDQKAQKAQEEAITAEETKKAAISKQKGLLPLGAGGTGTEQVWQASYAIRDLTNQLEIAPDYLKPIIQGQIAQLQDFVKSQKGIESIKYSLSVGQDLTPQQQRELELTSERNRAGMFAQDFAKEYGISVTDAMQTGLRYSQHPESEEFANLTREQRTSLAWVGTEVSGGGGGSPPPEPTPFQPPGAGQASIPGSMTWKKEFERRYPQIAEGFISQPAKERTEQGWVSYLKKRESELKEEWESMPYSYRGERPYAFQPTIRTLG
uniref:Uncharacterized protein n=1 Tax=viral metagenome TaxID=1070528 RepID=A0A6M3Y420_9ZZZZ